MTIDAEAVAAGAEAVRARIGAAGGVDVAIVAVTKGFGADAIAAAEAAGLEIIGESYAQECIAKVSGLSERPTLHFIGGLQRNKVRKLAPLVDVWQSVDRLDLGAEIARRSPGASVMVQVDISNEATKGGCAPDATPALVEELHALGLDVCGLMGIAPLAAPVEAAPGFSRLRRMVDTLGLRECSMGMSADLEVAIAEGTTMVRVGRDLFGPRPS